MLYEYHNTVCEILNEYLKKNYQNGYRKETIDNAILFSITQGFMNTDTVKC